MRRLWAISLLGRSALTEAYAGRMANNKAGKLHADIDCPFIGPEPRPVDPERHLREEWCRHCTGRSRRGDPRGHGHYESLLAAAEQSDGGEA